jgi:hypothetical protein
MRRLVFALLAAAAFAAPATATALPAPPDPTPPALRGTPYLVREDAHRVTLHVRFDRRLGQRFDGEPLATAAIDGRLASLAPLADRRGSRRTACYAASAWIERADPGRLVAVSVTTEGTARATVSALVAIRPPRPGDARGAPLRC